jgi:hypothetical protein
MRPSARRLVLFRVIDRITAIFGGRAPLPASYPSFATQDPTVFELSPGS